MYILGVVISDHISLPVVGFQRARANMSVYPRSRRPAVDAAAAAAAASRSLGQGGLSVVVTYVTSWQGEDIDRQSR